MHRLFPPRRLALALAALLVLTGCTVPTPPSPVALEQAGPRSPVDEAAFNFISVVRRVEPVAEAYCRERNRNRDCDFRILVDDRPGQPPNAFQTLDRRGRPIIVFTLPLIADARNQDELAFILGHEAGHHIAGHIERAQANAQVGAAILGGLAEAAGQTRATVNEAERLGAVVGFRRYAQEFELEADAIGTVIAARSGYDPLRGSEFFARIPDPGNQFLGTHPPNAERKNVVRRTVASLP